ncbi:uncharacterized protein LOC113203507 [Frankliniella occidentalis]|uniref:Uncharacterized protein LOC113203507 n=1 Tax=Frankliniella occidentalis TaxID=133901 RepID=A0A6J1S5J2_FRAOC|nr:uncharacterized protein LOC113203507 [Frankliniella occidentalis]
MDELRSDLLALVVSYLSLKDALACRLVCKRLAGLGQHYPEVWERRALSVEDGPTACPLLRLAPCARVLSTAVPATAPRCHHGDLRTTACAARELSISMKRVRTEDAAEAVQIIKRQEALGRLRAVRLHFDVDDGASATEDAVASLFGTLSSTPGLEGVALSGNMGDLRMSRVTGVRGSIKPSLKSFACHLAPGMLPFFKCMLAGHASTLEAVHFDTSSACSAAPAGSVARLLAGLPRLRKLSCPLVPGLDKLAECESLREVKLTVTRDGADNADNAAGAAQLIGAEQLRSVHLCFLHGGASSDDEYEDVDSDDSDIFGLFDEEPGEEVARNLTMGLVMGDSKVEELFLEIEGESLQSVPVQLMLGLRYLPTLRRLRIKMCMFSVDEVLRGIFIFKLPSLQSLQIVLQDGIDDGSSSRCCFHWFLHHDTVKKVLLKNPWLHVELQNAIFCKDVVSEETCEYCEPLVCHQELYDVATPAEYVVGIFTHPPDACPSAVHHASGRRWFHTSDL